ncbi:hypothetical protein [Methylococcus capsulatus]|uniref:hypothetical protein n=1 Tax=Methylococcus capsulatus TaxID=414 RepID=UPI001C52793F|nr:hypothetical protein [Methylococcus capsulatus]QXP90261.1 hypothetical protein KW114_14640 [Methylococcus capsulatus]
MTEDRMQLSELLEKAVSYFNRWNNPLVKTTPEPDRFDLATCRIPFGVTGGGKERDGKRLHSVAPVLLAFDAVPERVQLIQEGAFDFGLRRACQEFCV